MTNQHWRYVYQIIVKDHKSNYGNKIFKYNEEEMQANVKHDMLIQGQGQL